MKTTIDGKRYNSDRCEDLAEYNHRSNGNYSGRSTLMMASDGTYLVEVASNGQDCYLTDDFGPCYDVNEFIERARLTDEQEERLVALGLLEIVR